jgi:hypothetical protein
MRRLHLIGVSSGVRNLTLRLRHPIHSADGMINHEDKPPNAVAGVKRSPAL